MSFKYIHELWKDDVHDINKGIDLSKNSIKMKATTTVITLHSV